MVDDLNNYSEYRAMWLFVMFDLPTVTKAEKREYRHFRTYLLKQGFSQFQYSIYGRFCGSMDKVQGYYARIEGMLPPEGHVRLLAVTDRQFGMMKNFHGKKRKKTEEPPEQLVLF